MFCHKVLQISTRQQERNAECVSAAVLTDRGTLGGDQAITCAKCAIEMKN